MTTPAPVMTMSGVSKRFGATQALDAVDLTLYPGEVHALVGENGAGKSTLIKIMTGIYHPDAGTVEIDGAATDLRNAAEAQRRGVAAIYQEPLIFPDLNVAENIFIGHQDRGPLVRWSELYRDAEAILSRLDVDLDPRTPASGLPVAAQQAIEIAKAISLDVRVLIMDEPTASLSAHEASRLFEQVRRLKDDGVAILFISHRLEEIFEIADRITVFRDGRHISTRPAPEVTEELLIREMVGREVSEFFSRSEHPLGTEIMTVEGLGRIGEYAGIDFGVRRGEVLGVAGLVGAGRTEVALALFGIEPADTGTIRLDGRPVKIGSPKQAMAHGIAYLSEDRRDLGLSLPQSVVANVTLATLRRYLNRWRLLDSRAERAVAEDYRGRLGIKASSLARPVGELSGGNQQKTMLAKWLNTDPKVLILDEPTRGIDVGAKTDVHRIIDELARAGLAVILISSDLPEVLAMSDRVLVMREGRSMGVFARGEATQEDIMTAALGAA